MSENLFKCPDCAGLHFNITENGKLICTSVIVSGDVVGCGYSGSLPINEHREFKMELTRDDKLHELALQFKSDLERQDKHWRDEGKEIPEHYHVTLCRPPRSVLALWIETLKPPTP